MALNHIGDVFDRSSLEGIGIDVETKFFLLLFIFLMQTSFRASTAIR